MSSQGPNQPYPPPPHPYGQGHPHYPPPPAPYPPPYAHQPPAYPPQQQVPHPQQNVVPTAPLRKSRSGLILTAAVAATVVVVAGGTAVGYQLLGGGGDRPEQHLPANTAALAAIDLDPGPGQKVDAVRFLSKFPDSDFSESEDPRKSLWESVTEGIPTAPPWSEVEPWMGDQAAIAVVPKLGEADKPAPVVAVAVTDEQAALTSLTELEDTAVAVGDGWAYLSEDQAQADATLAGARSTPLSADATFSADLDRIGERGIATAWFDGGRLSAFAEALGSTALRGLTADPSAFMTSAHGAMTFRFSGSSLELTGDFTGLKQPAPPSGTTGVEDLPAGTLAAFGVVGLGAAVGDAWTDLRNATESVAGGALDALEQDAGLRLPEDLTVLLGTSTTVAVGRPAPSGDPSVALRVRTSGNYRAVLSKLFGGGGTGGIIRRDLSDGYVLSTTEQQAEELVSGSGLTGSERFTRAVPELDGANAVAYADIAGLIAAYGSDLPADDRKNFEPLDSAGLSVHSKDGDYRFNLRVTTR